MNRRKEKISECFISMSRNKYEEGIRSGKEGIYIKVEDGVLGDQK